MFRNGPLQVIDGEGSVGARVVVNSVHKIGWIMLELFTNHRLTEDDLHYIHEFARRRR